MAEIATQPALTGPPQENLAVPARLDALVLAGTWAEEVAGRLALPRRTLFALQICLEECLSNIVRHGQLDGQVELHVHLQCQPGEVRVVVEDPGPPFDPCGHAVRARPAALADVEPGGEGIALMRHFARSIGYERVGSRNRTVFQFDA